MIDQNLGVICNTLLAAIYFCLNLQHFKYISKSQGSSADLVHGGVQQSCIDEELLTLLDFTDIDTVPDWYATPEYCSLIAVPSIPVAESMDAMPNHQDASSLDMQATCQSVLNHVWELGSCPWNAS